MKRYIITLLIAVLVCGYFYFSSESFKAPGADAKLEAKAEEIGGYYKDLAVSLLMPEICGAASGYYDEQLTVDPHDVKIISVTRPKGNAGLYNVCVRIQPYDEKRVPKGVDQLTMTVSEDGNVEVIYYKCLRAFSNLIVPSE